jgi:tRNA pseudouridine55 synthase
VARRRPATVHGLVVVDKPAGITSHDVVGLLRRRFGERRVGHAGTLDPGATGVLVVGVGSVTRLLRFVTDGVKRYTGEIVLGAETDTLDADGVVTARHEMSDMPLEAVRRIVASHLVGPIEQIPPMVSALKVEGRRLHTLAREGVEIERQPRPVTVHAFDVITSVTGPDGCQVLVVDVTCSAGTYVRVLAADLGRLLGGGAHLRHLRRTAVGPFTIDEAGSPDGAALLPPEAAVRGLTRLVADEETAGLIATGRVLAAPPGAGPWAFVDGRGGVLAVYEPFRGQAKPAVVIPLEASASGGTG